MRIGFRVVFFLILLNMVSGLAYAIGIAGTEYSFTVTGTGDPADYEERFDPQGYLNKTQPETWSFLTFLGNIWTTIAPLWNAVRFTVFGFTSLLIEFGNMIPDSAARTVYTLICGVIAASQSFIVFAWLIQSFSGRRMQD